MNIQQDIQSVGDGQGPLPGQPLATPMRPWWKSRHLAASVPVLLVAALVGGIAIVRSRTEEAELQQRYLDAARAALRAQDLAAARTYYHKAVQLGDRRPESRYYLALCQEATGRHSHAAAIIARLAPLDRPVYYPAHLRQAQRLLQADKPSAADRDRAEVHLTHAIALEPSEAGAHALLAQLYWESGRYDEAEPHLIKAAPEAPALRLRLAERYADRNDWPHAAGEAKLASAYFRDRARSNPQDVPARIFWAEAEMLAGRHAEAARILKERIDSANRLVFSQALGRVYASWVHAVERKPGADPSERLTVVEEGLKYDPGNNELLSALMPDRLMAGESARARALLHRLISEGRAPAAANLILGMDAWVRRDCTAARVHWETALRLAPQMNMAANNLAWLLAHEEPRDLFRALALIDAVLERVPKELQFRGTRGLILARLGRWREALPDLVAALPAYQASPAHHLILSDAYQHLGLNALALEHRNRAELLDKKEIRQ